MRNVIFINNTTLYQLEKERRNKIINLKPDEVESYIDSLNKRMAGSYGNVANDFRADMDVFLKSSDLLDEVVNLLKHTYPNVSTYVAWSRVDSLVDKLREVSDDVHETKLKKNLHDLTWSYICMRADLIILHNIMEVYYDFYKCRGIYDNIFHVIAKTSLDDDEKRKVITALDELPVYDFYNDYFMQSMDVFLEIMLKIMKSDHEILLKLCNFSIGEESSDDEFFNEFRKNMLEYQQLSKDLLEEYDAYMEDGFHKAKEMERQILCDAWHDNSLYKNGTMQDRDYVEYIQYNRPSYDLKTMTFIPSQHDLDKMAAYEEGFNE